MEVKLAEIVQALGRQIFPAQSLGLMPGPGVNQPGQGAQDKKGRRLHHIQRGAFFLTVEHPRQRDQYRQVRQGQEVVAVKLKHQRQRQQPYPPFLPGQEPVEAWINTISPKTVTE